MGKGKNKDSFRSVFTARIRGKSAKQKQEETESRATFQYVGGELTIEIVSNVIVKHRVECPSCIRGEECVDLNTLRAVANDMRKLGAKRQPIVVGLPQSAQPNQAQPVRAVPPAPDYF